MPYNFAAKGLRTKKLCSRLSSRKIHFCTQNGHCAFLSNVYAVYLKLIGKLLVDFLLVLTELGGYV